MRVFVHSAGKLRYNPQHEFNWWRVDNGRVSQEPSTLAQISQHGFFSLKEDNSTVLVVSVNTGDKAIFLWNVATTRRKNLTGSLIPFGFALEAENQSDHEDFASIAAYFIRNYPLQSSTIDPLDACFDWGPDGGIVLVKEQWDRLIQEALSSNCSNNTDIAPELPSHTAKFMPLSQESLSIAETVLSKDPAARHLFLISRRSLTETVAQAPITLALLNFDASHYSGRPYNWPEPETQDGISIVLVRLRKAVVPIILVAATIGAALGGRKLVNAIISMWNKTKK